MKPFTFRLERVLELRAAAERQQAGVVGEAASLESARRRDSDASAAHLDAIHDQLGGGQATLAAGLRCAYGLSVDAAHLHAVAAASAHADAESQQHEALARFAEMRSSRMSVERLRERQAADWSIATARSDQADTDEIARQLHAGQRAAS